MVAIYVPVKHMIIATISQLLVGQPDSEMRRWVRMRRALGSVKASTVLGRERLDSNASLRSRNGEWNNIPNLGLVEGYVVANVQSCPEVCSDIRLVPMEVTLGGFGEGDLW